MEKANSEKTEPGVTASSVGQQPPPLRPPWLTTLSQQLLHIARLRAAKAQRQKTNFRDRTDQTEMDIDKRRYTPDVQEKIWAKVREIISKTKMKF